MFPISKRMARALGRRRSRAAELTGACGRARSRGDSARGSALVLVVGALALVAIFAAVYVTVGRADRRTSAAVEQNRKVAEFPLKFSSYFAQIIANDRLAVETRIDMSFNGDGGPVGGSVGGGGGGGSSSAGAPEIRQRFYREATDFPYTAYGIRSLPNLVPGLGNNRPLVGFNAPGTAYDPDSGLGGWNVTGSTIAAQISELALDPRVASDPWLASTEPTYLGSPDFADRLYSADVASNPATQARLLYLDKRDWAHITNISPDGLFVNLWNLRPEAGGFGAESGFTRGGFSTGTPRMSDNLSLVQMSGDVDDPLQAMDVRNTGLWIPGHDQPVSWGVTPFSAEDPENHPAVWSNNQRFMLIPLEQPFLFYNPVGYTNPSGGAGRIADWSSPYFPAYQYADADGDGLADARWFELTDSSDTTGFNQWLTRDLASVDGYRLFAAARVVDLSAMANVNTATDSLAPPTNVAPLGATPADVDLRRLLSMQDVARNWLDWKNLNKNAALTSIKRDGRPGWAGGQDTDPYSDYSNYQINVDTNVLQPFDARRSGWTAYDALGKAILSEGALGETIAGSDGPRSALFETSRFYDDVAGEALGTHDGVAARKRLFWGLDIGALDTQDPAAVGQASIASGWFDMSDLAELLTFRGINDDQVFSRLEQTVQGRYDNRAGGANVSVSALRLGPLISERPTEMDRKRHDTLYGDYDRNRPYQPTGQVDPDTMALLAVSPRLRLTTYSGATDIFGGRLDSAQLMTLEADDVPEYLPEFLGDIDSGGTSRLDVFKTYFKALAGAARTRKAWAISDPVYEQMQTVFYGHQGPELATRLSGHLAANLYDMYDADDDPTALSIWVVSPASSGFPSGDPALTWGGIEIDLTNIDNDNYTAEDPADVDATAYTVFGVEAYPVLTEAASMVVVTDAANSINGSSDDGGGGNPWQPVGGGADEEITINVDGWDGDPGGTYSANQAWQRNADLAFVAIAFQVANPFEDPIDLSDFYFEYNGHFFRAGTGQLLGGHAKTLYCLANPDFQDVADKWEDLLQGYNSAATLTAAEVQTWCNQQFKQASAGDNMVDDPERVERFNPSGGAVLTGYANFLATAGAGVPGRPADDRTVRLWRRMPANPDQDMLVDRLRQPVPTGPGGFVGISDPVLVPVPDTIDKAEVSGTVAGPETSGGNIGGNDNTGFTFVFYGSISRGDHPDSADGDHAVSSSVPGAGNGVLPAWMIDGHSQTTLRESTPLVNTLSGTGEDANPDQLKDDYFLFTRRYAFKSFDDFVDETSPIVATVATHPNEKNSMGAPVDNSVFDRSSALIKPLHSNTLYTPATEPRTALYPELVSTERDVYTDSPIPNPYNSSLPARRIPLVRLTDLLQVPAVGWVYRPDPASPGQRDEDNWTTFGEALAYALDVMDPNDRDADPVLAKLTREVTLGGSARTEFVLDNLNLRTDAYAPFFNANASSDTFRLYEPDRGDLRIGSGIPLALDLLSKFRTLGPDDPDEALTTKVMGRINLATAGPDVLRTVPGLSPSLETDTALTPEWWGSAPSALGAFADGLPDAIADSATFEAPDVAAQLISYRDRLAGEYRAASYDYSTLSGVLGNGPLGYRSFDFLSPGAWMPADAAQVAMRNFKPDPSPTANELGRTILTGIEGLREQPGFSSVAEAGAAVFNRSYLVNQLGLPDTDYEKIRQNQPTYLGIDEDSGAPRNTGSVTSGSDVVTIETHLYNDQNDDVPNDTEERLAILNALSGTTSVRSDVFAVWFVVHGYREADVANLRPSDPLVPSYARRVLMVVDRSNVTSIGQAPRILLYKELPL